MHLKFYGFWNYTWKHSKEIELRNKDHAETFINQILSRVLEVKTDKGTGRQARCSANNMYYVHSNKRHRFYEWGNKSCSIAGPQFEVKIWRNRHLVVWHCIFLFSMSLTTRTRHTKYAIDLWLLFSVIAIWNRVFVCYYVCIRGWNLLC